MFREEASPGSPLPSATGSQRPFSNIMPSLKTFWKKLVFSRVIQGWKSERNTGDEEPDEGRSTLKDNSMTISICFKREVMVPPFFVFFLLMLFLWLAKANQTNCRNHLVTRKLWKWSEVTVTKPVSFRVIRLRQVLKTNNLTVERYGPCTYDAWPSFRDTHLIWHRGSVPHTELFILRYRAGIVALTVTNGLYIL